MRIGIGLIGKKLGMVRVFDDRGDSVSATVIEAGPCPVVQVKAAGRGEVRYDAVQLGFGPKREKVTTKPMLGHFKKAEVGPLRHLVESRVEEAGKYSVGQVITAEIFGAGERVDVSGTSKGRGFAGIHKRHHFAGGPETHGSTRHRAPGSIGASAFPSRVLKGLRMAGRMGGAKVTARGLTVLEVRPEENHVLVEGSVPGPTNGIVVIRKSRLQPRKRKAPATPRAEGAKAGEERKQES